MVVWWEKRRNSWLVQWRRGGIDGCLMGGEATSMVGYGRRRGIDDCLMGGEATSMVGYGRRRGIDGCLMG
jgi:hypothetical protein